MSKNKDNFIGFNTNRDSREKAMQSVSPNVSKLMAVKFDNNTTIYFKKGTKKERIEERLKIYKANKFSWE